MLSFQRQFNTFRVNEDLGRQVDTQRLAANQQRVNAIGQAAGLSLNAQNVLAQLQERFAQNLSSSEAGIALADAANILAQTDSQVQEILGQATSAANMEASLANAGAVAANGIALARAQMGRHLTGVFSDIAGVVLAAFGIPGEDVSVPESTQRQPQAAPTAQQLLLAPTFQP